MKSKKDPGNGSQDYEIRLKYRIRIVSGLKFVKQTDLKDVMGFFRSSPEKLQLHKISPA